MTCPRSLVVPWAKNLAILATGLAALGLPAAVAAVPLTVIDVRGNFARIGQKVDGSAVLELKEGERIVLVAPDGRIMTLKGPYRGPASRTGGSVQDQRAALSALITLRDQRANSIGAVRSGSENHALPDPWLIDISRPGDRCVLEGTVITWWRPQVDTAESFSVIPLDRSWRADFTWSRAQGSMIAPQIARLASARSFIIRHARRELPIRLNVIPGKDLEPLVLAAWLLEKGCIQQADALLSKLAAEQAGGLGVNASQLGPNALPADPRSQ